MRGVYGQHILNLYFDFMVYTNITTSIKFSVGGLGMDCTVTAQNCCATTAAMTFIISQQDTQSY